MENITLSLWVFAMSLHIAFLVALIALAQALRRSIGIRSPSWIAIFFFLQSLGEYANPFLMKLLTEERMALKVPNASITLGQFFAFLSSAHLIFLLLAAFGLLALVVADLSHSRGGRWRHTIVTLVSAFRVGWPSPTQSRVDYGAVGYRVSCPSSGFSVEY